MAQHFRLLACIVALFPAFARGFQVMAHNDGESAKNHFLFIENKGQWPDQVEFAVDFPEGKLFIEKGGVFTYVLADYGNLHQRYFEQRANRDENFGINCHAWKVRFEGADPEAKPIGLFTQTKFNYFKGNDPSRWAGNAGSCEELVIFNLYHHVNLRLYSDGHTLKYDLEILFGARLNDIRLVYEGLNEMQLRDGKLILKTSVGEIVEAAPVSWAAAPYGTKKPVNSGYILNGNELSYYLEEDGNRIDVSDHFYTIDPTLLFSTYTGSSANNFGFSATYDDAGNLYAGGIAYGIGYPTTVGAYSTTFGGGDFDVSISKFSPAGVYLWGTYIGGSANDQPHSMVTNAAGDLFIMGRTFSVDYPVTAGCVDNTFNGACDFLVSRLSTDGSTLQASTYIGGTGEDALNMTAAYVASSIKTNYGDDARGEIIVDDLGDVYVAGCTKSNDFPATSGAFQTSNQGLQDGCVFKLNPDFTSLLWCTYLGGSGDDAAYSLKVDAANTVYTTGATGSINFPTTSGVLNPSDLGGIDGFVTHLNSGGTGLVKSTYIGTGSYDACYFVELDASDNVYVVGQSSGPYPTTAGVWSVPGSSQFIAKFNSSLSATTWSTVFGNGGLTTNISPTAFLVDVCGYIYVTGWGGGVNFTGSTAGMPVTGDAYQSTTDGSDLYLMVLTENATALSYATFMGGPISQEHVDGGTSRFSKTRQVYQAVCAGCFFNSDFPTVNAYSTLNNSSCNLACFKMDIPLPTILAAFDVLPEDTGCAPLNVNFDNNSVGGATFFWDFDDGGTSTSTNPTHSFGPGVWNVMLVANGSPTCFLVDTAWHTIVVYPSPPADAGPDATICAGDSVQLSGSGGSGYTWSPGASLSSTTDPDPYAFPSGTQTYYLTVSDTNGCTATDSVTVTISTVTANAGPDIAYCLGGSGTFTGSGGTTYSWSPPSGLTSPGTGTTGVNAAVSGTYILTAWNAIGCFDTDTVQLTVHPLPAVNSGPDEDICAGDTVQIFASGASSYLWTPSLSLSSGTAPDPFAFPVTSTTYTVTGTDGNGCTDTATVVVNVLPAPIANAGADVHICEDSTTQLTASGGGSYFWTPNYALSSNTIPNPVAFPTVPTTYILTVTSANGCTDEDTISVDVTPTPQPNIQDASICLGHGLWLEASGADTYLWSTGETTWSIWVQPTTTTQYIVVTTVNGCPSKPDTATVFVDNNLPVASFTMSADSGFIPAPVTFNNTSVNAVSYYWTFGTAGNSTQVSPTITFGEEGYHQAMLIAYSATGCSDTAYSIFRALDYSIFIPNAFTPNGDNTNEFFQVETFGIRDFHVRIYDRWGALIYESYDQEFRWNGTYHVNDCQEGAYVWVIDAVSVTDKVIEKAGTVTLMR